MTCMQTRPTARCLLSAVALTIAATVSATAFEAKSVRLPVVRGLDGRVIQLAANEGGVTALVFYSTECPISNAYSPTLNALRAEFDDGSLKLVGLCVDPDLEDEAIAQHAREYQVSFPTARDRDGSLARRLGVTVTPEAVLIDAQGRIRYLGRIDDQYAARQRRNANPRTRELHDAIAAVLVGCEVVQSRVEAVGCPLPEVEKGEVEPTYAGEVAAILRNHCVGCHMPGEVGPFALETYEQARKRAHDIAAVVEDRRMPPWKPVPGVGPGFLHDKSLAETEIKTLVAWAEQGAPGGDLLKLPPRESEPHGPWKLGTPDLILELPESFAVPADGEDVYRCFVIPTGLKEQAAIAAVEYQPGNRAVVHHMLGYVDTKGQARQKDAAEPGPGYTCFSGPEVEVTGDLGGWAPGNEPNFLGDGIGRVLPANSDVVVQVHYHPTGKPETDRSRIGLYVLRTKLRQSHQVIAAVARDLVLPAGHERIEIGAELTLPVDVSAHSVTPHMHLLGRDMRVWVERPDGSTTDLIRIDDWDFNWQNTYYFASPLDLPKGAKVKLSAHFDNSSSNPRNPNSPPREVRWGEATTDEMCIAFLGVTKKGQDLTRPGEKDDLREIFSGRDAGLEP